MGRAPCCDKANVKKGPWSPEEDAKLKSYIEAKGTGGNWIALPQKIGLKRCGKSCRLRWLNYLRPNIKHGGFTEEEENIICSLYVSIGSRWSIIAAQLPGRTDNDIKNYWNTRLKKKLMVKQRKEQAVSRLLEQEIKRERESETYLVNQTMNQLPYWSEHQTLSIPMIHPNHDVHHLGNQEQYTRLMMKIEGQLYDDAQLNNFQYPTQDQLYVVDKSEVQALAMNSTANMNFTQWLNTDQYDVPGMRMHNQGQENFAGELEVYFSNQQSIDGNESYSGGIDVGNSSTTSNSAGSSSWGDINSIVNTPVSSFDAYQNGVLQAL
ncbi:hypothetical protein BVRB_6g128660 [Beta vulgaris subsp. vulgaris]|uniref:transcription factor RAX3 n=1 Tax=Beta vulgaris subsp. vulgaris TaxID=3555 RepID=UPI0005400112|nr:transcription factor RAX3 [Beta vulgaris subsp. vulgaris]KMT09892.1 hypothetical protein BVRB_6g128660 [Beta vulgaris subsp. vulgaris]